MRLQEAYKKEILPQLQEKFGYKNQFQVPRVKKVVINVGFGRHSRDSEYTKNLEESLVKITGQKPVFTKARKSVASFKVREGMVIGAKVTLRGKRMYDFLERVIHVALPRSKDFRGIDLESLDEHGNLSFSFEEQVAFPEVKAEDTDQIFGLEVTVVTDSNRERALKLLSLLDFPFKEL